VGVLACKAELVRRGETLMIAFTLGRLLRHD